MHIGLERCHGPRCTRCGCEDTVILQEPNAASSWWSSGRARCRHCRNTFAFSRAVATPANPAAAPPQSPPTLPTAAAIQPPPPRPLPPAPTPPAKPKSPAAPPIDGLVPGLVFTEDTDSEAPTAADASASNPPPGAPGKSICPECGGRYWVYKTRGDVQYRKCKDCGHAGEGSKTLR